MTHPTANKPNPVPGLRHEYLWHWGEILLGASAWSLLCWAVVGLFSR